MNKLKTFCIIIWGLVLLLFVFIVHRINTADTIKTAVIERKEVEKVIEKPVIVESMEITKHSLADEISEAVYSASKKHNIPTYVIYAIIATESGKTKSNEFNETNILDVNKNAKSSVGCIGLMQVSPKWVLPEYNKYYKKNYTEQDLYNVFVNIDVGTWHYKQFMPCTKNWVELYVIYNVGYTEYNKINRNFFYGYDDKWYCDYRNKFFYMNDMYPPTISYAKGLYGKKNKLPPYNAKKRFENALKVCEEYLNY